MAPRKVYNPKTNRWENAVGSGGDTPAPPRKPVQIPEGTDVTAGDGEPWNWSDIPSTTTAPQNRKAPTTSVPQNKATTTSTVAPKTSQKRSRNSGRGMGGPTAQQVKAGQYVGGKGFKTEGQDVVERAVQEILGDNSTDSLLQMLLQGQDGSGGGGTRERSIAQRVADAKRFGRQNTALAKKFYGQQQSQANAAIDAATADLLKNLIAPQAYNNMPLTTVQQQPNPVLDMLLSYGATGQQAADVAAQNQQDADMYTALLRSGAKQLGQAETGYFNALKNAATQAQTQGKQDLAQTIAGLQSRVLLDNLQAILNAQQ